MSYLNLMPSKNVFRPNNTPRRPSEVFRSEQRTRKYNYNADGETSFSRNYTTNYHSPKRRRKGKIDDEVEALKKGFSCRTPPGLQTPQQQGNGKGNSQLSLEPTPELTTYGGIKLGWIQGVLIPCLLNIWGVVLFLRMSWIVGQAGIGVTMAIIGVSTIVCVVTTLSLSAICTNGELKGGGVYYLVSRSLGAEFGASVGILFAFANAVAASMNTIGFCDSLNQLLKSNKVSIIDNDVNDTRIVGALALLVMCLICAIGMDWETKTQNFLITVIVLAIANFLVGVALGPKSNTEVAKGFIGVNHNTLHANSVPDFRFSEGREHNVFTVFSIFFPAVTGVQAGANICGDLKNPATAIPKGTLIALFIAMLSYAMIAMLCGAGALRDASGTGNITSAALASCTPDCDYGLHNDYDIMKLMSAWGPLLYAGCWAATLSTALTNLLSVPRLIQALGMDRIYPGLIFFAKPYGKHGEPYRGYALTFLVSLGFMLIADLNSIAPLITNVYLASYALINFCTFHAAFVHHISWRPSFRFYNLWVSLLGAVVCCAIMIILNWLTAVITLFAFLVLYLIVHYRKPAADWGSSTEAQKYLDVVRSLSILNQKQSVKSYNPQLIVLSGPPGWRPALLQVAALITPGTYCLVAEVHEEKLTLMERKARSKIAYQWLRSLPSGFYTVVDSIDLEGGVRAILQAAGMGRLSPNIVMLGYKYNWQRARDIEVYFRVLRIAFEHDLAVTILRTPTENRSSESLPPLLINSGQLDPSILEMRSLLYQDSNLSVDGNITIVEGGDPKNASLSWKTNEGDEDRSLTPSTSSVRRLRIYTPMKLHTGTLDAWWLFDDGGMNILLPYIIAKRGVKPPLRMRVFALTRDTRNRNISEIQLKDLLEKYRISYESLNLLNIGSDPPMATSWDLFNSLIDKTADEGKNCLVQNAELEKWHAKTSRQLRLRELLFENSRNATFIVMNLPLPRTGLPPALYMAWLEVLSRDLPPMLFVRGNGQQVLSTEA